MPKATQRNGTKTISCQTWSRLNSIPAISNKLANLSKWQNPREMVHLALQGKPRKTQEGIQLYANSWYSLSHKHSCMYTSDLNFQRQMHWLCNTFIILRLQKTIMIMIAHYRFKYWLICKHWSFSSCQI